MLIVMHHSATDAQIDAVEKAVRDMGLQAVPIPGSMRTAIGVLGNQGYVDDSAIRELPGVRETIHVSKPYKLVSRDFHPESTVVDVKGVKFGDGCTPVIIAGPCSIESEAQMLAAAREVKAAGARILRGGAFKPRTSPYSFQGLEEEGLKLLAKARDLTGLPFVTEVIDPESVDLVASYSDMLQIGARNSQNFALLKKVGQIKKPILLKRGMSMTIQEFL
ncbi:MAG TPA: 3-deoxy-7-phosphoheptulonate synthase, partial [Desulfuromonas sp.]|nr:3-deoxy-7-phosphoheptulonate synthase [Desulfuromonas sp.]